MAKKDYYQVLGVAKNASKEDIKKAYKKLAREHHPDVVADGDKKAAEERFKEINEAYQVLSDDQKRGMYDQFGHTGAGFNPNQGPGGFGGQWGPFSYSYSSSGQGFENIDPLDIFEEFFGFRGFGGARRPRKGKNLYYEMRVDFKDAIFGAEKEVKVESGNIKIKVPQGVRDGTEMRFPNKGLPGPDNLPPGDLFISFKVSTPQEFKRAGDNLGLFYELNFVQAIIGDVIDIPVIDLSKADGIGKTKLKIPQGTQTNTQFLVRGKGMPRLNGRGQGDIIVQTNIKIPERLTKQQKEMLQKYREL